MRSFAENKHQIILNQILKMMRCCVCITRYDVIDGGRLLKVRRFKVFSPSLAPDSNPLRALPFYCHHRLP